MILSNLRTMTDEDICRLAHSEGKTAASPIIGELVKRLEQSLDREGDLQAQIPPQETSDEPVAIPYEQGKICLTCGAKVS